MEYHAHTPNDHGEWRALAEHIRAVAHLACEFATHFDAGRSRTLPGYYTMSASITRSFRSAYASETRSQRRSIVAPTT